MNPFARRQPQRHPAAKRELSIGEYIPYKCHWDLSTVITKDEQLLQVIKVQGFAFETADDEDVDMKKAVRNSLLRSMAGGNYHLWFHTIRKRKSAFPGGEMPPGFAHTVNEMWRHKHHSKDSYINELYITVMRTRDMKGVAKYGNFLQMLYQKADRFAHEEYLREAHKDLNEMTQRILASLRDYNPRLLTTIVTERGAFSEPLEFLGSLLNCGIRQPVLLPSMDASHYICNHRIYFGRRAIEIRGPHTRKYAGIVSIKEYPAQTAAGMLDAFLQLPFEFIITQSYSFTARQTAIGKMQVQQNRMIQAQDVAISQVAEISEALDLAMSGHVAFGTHHLSVMCMEDNLKAMEETIGLCLSELTNVGINATREYINMEPAFWSQLPGNGGFIARKADINSMNLAGLASLHNYPVGRIAGNHWGSAITVFETTSGTPYFFNFHLRDVGHTTIIGPTGAGKTVLMNFLIAQAQKAKCRVFFFDKDKGAEIFIRALKGVYTIIQPSDDCGFNPLQLPDTLENRSFLVDWFKAMVTTHDEPFTAEDMDRINEAISGNYKLDRSDRILHNVAPFFGLEGPGTIGGRLRMWHGTGPYAKLFDNPLDTIDFSENSIFAFEMGQVLADKTSLGPVLLYLFHKISLSLDGTPTMIVLDEAWALIDNDIFAPKIKDWLKTLRKLNALVVFATQSVEDASKSAISDTLIQQTATQIFLPNMKATEAYKTAFMLSDREFTLLKTTDPGSRFFLVKQGMDVVVARIDLSGMTEVINVLSGRAETVAILDEVRASLPPEQRDDPEYWMLPFQQGVKRLNDAKR
ncbi:MAG: VirB4 family type IV secretion/conjugal transfer ATPase [Alphaproteobacteria bacterium]|nr:VirB4 family type IV secretion/conjugal transfer ATPase [Alphaproteobacteria bacterium]